MSFNDSSGSENPYDDPRYKDYFDRQRERIKNPRRRIYESLSFNNISDIHVDFPVKKNNDQSVLMVPPTPPKNSTNGPGFPVVIMTPKIGEKSFRAPVTPPVNKIIRKSSKQFFTTRRNIQNDFINAHTSTPRTNTSMLPPFLPIVPPNLLSNRSERMMSIVDSPKSRRTILAEQSMEISSSIVEPISSPPPLQPSSVVPSTINEDNPKNRATIINSNIDITNNNITDDEDDDDDENDDNFPIIYNINLNNFRSSFIAFKNCKSLSRNDRKKYFDRNLLPKRVTKTQPSAIVTNIIIEPVQTVDGVDEAIEIRRAEEIQAEKNDEVVDDDRIDSDVEDMIQLAGPDNINTQPLAKLPRQSILEQLDDEIIENNDDCVGIQPESPEQFDLTQQDSNDNNQEPDEEMVEVLQSTNHKKIVEQPTKKTKLSQKEKPSSRRVLRPRNKPKPRSLSRKGDDKNQPTDKTKQSPSPKKSSTLRRGRSRINSDHQENHDDDEIYEADVDERSKSPENIQRRKSLNKSKRHSMVLEENDDQPPSPSQSSSRDSSDQNQQSDDQISDSNAQKSKCRGGRPRIKPKPRSLSQKSNDKNQERDDNMNDNDSDKRRQSPSPKKSSTKATTNRKGRSRIKSSNHQENNDDDVDERPESPENIQRGNSPNKTKQRSMVLEDSDDNNQQNVNQPPSPENSPSGSSSSDSGRESDRNAQNSKQSKRPASRSRIKPKPRSSSQESNDKNQPIEDNSNKTKKSPSPKKSQKSATTNRRGRSQIKSSNHQENDHNYADVDERIQSKSPENIQRGKSLNKSKRRSFVLEDSDDQQNDNQPPSRSSSHDSSHQNQQSDDQISESNTQNSKQPKRRRGRPPKKSLKIHSFVLEECDESEASDNRIQTPSPVKSISKSPVKSSQKKSQRKSRKRQSQTPENSLEPNEPPTTRKTRFSNNQKNAIGPIKDIQLNQNKKIDKEKSPNRKRRPGPKFRVRDESPPIDDNHQQSPQTKRRPGPKSRIRDESPGPSSNTINNQKSPPRQNLRKKRTKVTPQLPSNNSSDESIINDPDFQSNSYEIESTTTQTVRRSKRSLHPPTTFWKVKKEPLPIHYRIDSYKVARWIDNPNNYYIIPKGCKLNEKNECVSKRRK